MIDKKQAKLLDETTNGKWRDFVDPSKIENSDIDTFAPAEDSYTIKPLHSVGCVIVSEGVGIGITYPMYKDGSWDESSGIHLEDVDEEWFYRLNPEDNRIVQDVLFELNPNRLDKENI